MEILQGTNTCPLCTHTLRSHPRCALCSIFIGPGHVERSAVLIGHKHVCEEHGIHTQEALTRALRADIQTRRDYDLAPEMDVETEQLPRYNLNQIPDWLITPKQAAQLTGWNPHTVRVRIGKHKIEQLAWAISSTGWKAGLYEKERVLLILARIEEAVEEPIEIDLRPIDNPAEDAILN